MKFSLPLVILMFSCFLFAQAGEVHTVTPGMSVGDIQKQINNAQPNDIIRFSKGIYNLTGSLSVLKAIVLEGVPGDSAAVVMKVSDNFRHIKATTGRVVIKGITFEGRSNVGFGGGIEYLGQDSLIISGCEFRYNMAQEGGAVYSFGNLLLMSCLMSSNSATVNGGAVYIRGKAILHSCFLSENKSANLGGALFNMSRSKTRIEPVLLVASTFVKNTAEQGGAVSADNPVDTDACFFAENTAGISGGGAIFTANSATVSESVFYNNSSKNKGGGIFAQRLMKVTDCVFTGNRASDAGGAVFNSEESDSSVEEISIFQTSVFSKNESKSGGGIYSTLSSIVLDSFFDQNASGTSGGGIFCDKSLLVNRSSFDGNTAAAEGGAIDAGITRVFNTTMINNKAQNAGALHTYESAAVVLSTFSGNEAALKSGGVIYAKNIVLFGNIIAGNNQQDKVTGKIRVGEDNIIGTSGGNSLRDIFQDADNMRALPVREPGVVPALLIRNSGPASGKVLPGKLESWERELGVTDFFNSDQLRNKRSSGTPTDLGAVLYMNGKLSAENKQLPVVDIRMLMADVNSRKIPEVLSGGGKAPKISTVVPAGSKSGTKNINEASINKKKIGQSSLDEDLDRIVEAILSGEPFDVADIEGINSVQPDLAASKTKTSTSKSNNTSKNTNTSDKTKVKVSEKEKVQPEQPSVLPISSNTALGGVYTVDPKNPTGDRNFTSLEEAVNALNSYGTGQTVRFVITSGMYIVERPITISNAQHQVIFSSDENEESSVIIRSGGNSRAIVIAVASPVKMEGLVFEGPSAGSDGKSILNGGGISCNTDALLSFESCIFRYNKNQTGSGVFARKVFLSRCAFYDNVASDGAGVYATECTAVNSTFYGNRTAVGGGIYAKEKVTVVLCTFTQNEANGKGAALWSPNIYLYGNIVVGNKSGTKDKDIDGTIHANFSNILTGLPFNVFAEADAKGYVKLDSDTGNTPVVTIKPGGMASEQISESLLRQWEDELNLDRVLSVDQHGKHRPQNRNAEIGAWEIPDKRAY